MSTYNSISTHDVSPFETGAPEVVVTPTDKPSFVAVGYMVLLGDTVRGIFFPTLWPLVSSFGGTRAAQGVIVAAFSMGRVLVSPSYGRYSTNHGYRRVLVFAHCLIVVGALLYSRVWNLASLFCAQIVLGFGCGTLGVTRAYFAESVPRDLRTVYLGRVTAAQYAGLTMTSFLGSCLSHAGAYLRDETAADPAWAWLRLSPLTFASYAVLLGALVALLLLASPSFHDFVPAEKSAQTAPAALEEGAARAADRRHANLVWTGLVLNVITKGSIGCYETLGVAYAQANLDLPGPTTGYYVAACGAVGVAFLLSFKQLGRLFDDVELILYGIAVMVVSCVFMIRRAIPAAADADLLGIWISAMFAMYGVGYPVGHTAVIGWFSKAMKNRPQGMLMGLFASAGSLARIVFPICTGLVADSFGSDAVFATLATLLGATLCVLVAYRADFREAIA